MSISSKLLFPFKVLNIGRCIETGVIPRQSDIFEEIDPVLNRVYLFGGVHLVGALCIGPAPNY